MCLERTLVLLKIEKFTDHMVRFSHVNVVQPD